jgi:exopolysaccharide production protein ExoQ
MLLPKTDMRSPTQSEAVSVFEKIFVFSVLLLSTGAFMSLAVKRGQGQEGTTGEASMQLVWMGVYLVALVLLLWKCRAALKDLCREYLLVALSLFALSSTVWSDAPGVSLRRGIALVLTCVFGAYLGSRFSLREQLRLCAYVCVVCAVFSFIFGLLGLGNSVEDIPDAWYGIFVHKNVLGRMMVLSVLIFLVCAKTESEKKARHWFAAGLACLLLLLARSATSLAVLAAMLGFLACCRWLRLSKSALIKASIAGMVAFGLGVYWISQNLEQILELFGKDFTLTGRLQLWILSTVMAMQRPWFGHGYNAFWLGPGSASEHILAVVQWDAPHAHNGLLEVWLELGLAGVALFLAGFAVYVWRAIVFFRHDAAAESIWPLCFLTFMFLSNITESDFLARNTIFWILYVAAVVTLGRQGDAQPATASDLVKRSAPPRLAVPRVCEG